MIAWRISLGRPLNHLLLDQIEKKKQLKEAMSRVVPRIATVKK